MLEKGLPGIIIALAFFLVLPVMVHLPIYLFRYLRMKRLARTLGRQFKPSLLLVLGSLWAAIAFILMFHPLLRWCLEHEKKGPRQEVVTSLRAIHAAQAAYFRVHHTYAGLAGNDSAGAFAALNWSPPSESHYAYFLGGDCIPLPVQAPGENLDPATTTPDTTAYEFGAHEETVRLTSSVSDHGFTVIAKGNLDRDPCLDTWMINDTGRPVLLTNDADGWDPYAAPCCDVGPYCPGNEVPLLAKIEARMPHLCRRCPLGAYLSSTLIIVLPIVYSLMIRQNRLYRRALPAIPSGLDRKGEGVGA
jgi:hypothetical protein